MLMRGRTPALSSWPLVLGLFVVSAYRGDNCTRATAMVLFGIQPTAKSQKPIAKSRFSSCCPGFAGPIAQQFHFAAGIADFTRGMEVDAVVAPEVWADQA